MADDGDTNAAAELADRLRTGQKALSVAMAAVVDVYAGLATIAARPHFTAMCAHDNHTACLGACSCQDCQMWCECDCHPPRLPGKERA